MGLIDITGGIPNKERAPCCMLCRGRQNSIHWALASIEMYMMTRNSGIRAPLLSSRCARLRLTPKGGVRVPYRTVHVCFIRERR